MTKKKTAPSGETANVARTTLAKLSDAERYEIRRALQKAIDERDLPKFKLALLKLGFDEESAAYEQLMKLWDEHAKASRRG